MKKEEIYVTIDSEEKRLRAIEILEKAGEIIIRISFLYLHVHEHYKRLCVDKNGVWTLLCITHKTEITLDELEELLMPNYQVKDVVLSIDELKAQAEKLGYQLVEKTYKPKIGEFGVFYDGGKYSVYEFITEIDTQRNKFQLANYLWFDNFRKLTEEEKQKIQSAW